jgi:hypothetical protein
MKMTINELKRQISEIIEEAKKKDQKEKKFKRVGAQVEAYGFYDESHDFSEPLGVHNLYRQQGQVNWGPYTGVGPHVNQYGPANTNAVGLKETDEKALRSLVREVLENGLIGEESAWAPFLAKVSREPIFESSWHEAASMMNEEVLEEAWYDKKDKPDSPEGKSKGFEKDKERGHIKKHGFEKKDKKSKKSSKKSSSKK